ncbi:TRAP transporter substrate-binding protein [Thalassospira marina]|uniref:C4-dicarboxylate ABC transporter substrate-binding protein n=1 Tax=Thalassospira marina TaxID=2048283 RepID=A0ABN5FPB1_9PROT|nr:TRAP transporter substrate-binding protein [Thalassospira marina]AUG55371.1 hypothetical protein CSC3H3_21065 [Thalassospira marina]
MNPKNLFSLAALGIGCLVASTAWADEPIVLKFASPFSPKSITNAKSIPEFAAEIEKESGGTLKIEHYPGGILGPNPAAQLKLVEDGVVDIAEVPAAYTPGRFPELPIFELPFEYKSTVEASLTAYKMYEEGLLHGFDNLKLVGIAAIGPYYIHTKKEVTSADGLKGLKIRVGGPVQGEIMKRLGAVPVGGMSATQIAENISRGVIDGSLMDNGNLYNFRIADAADYHVTNVPLGNFAVLFPINKAKYESLPPKAKAALDKVGGKWFSRVLAQNLDAQNDETLASLKKDGKHQFLEFPQADLDAMKEKLASMKDKWDVEKDGVNLYAEMTKARAAIGSTN